MTKSVRILSLGLVIIVCGFILLVLVNNKPLAGKATDALLDTQSSYTFSFNRENNILRVQGPSDTITADVYSAHGLSIRGINIVVENGQADVSLPFSFDSGTFISRGTEYDIILT